MKTEKIKKVRGSVLFTVVAVLTLLVVFMAGTMILVASANHRSHINYSSAQTTVTSRTVAESVLKALELEDKSEEGKAFADYFYSVTESNPRIEIPVSINSSVAGATGGVGTIDNVVVSYAGQKDFYNDGSDGKVAGWVPRDILKVTAHVNLGRAESTSSIYLVVDPPETKNDRTDDYGFSPTGGAFMSCQTSLFGGAYIGLPEMSEAVNYDYSDPDTYRSGKSTKLENAGSIVEANSVFNGNLSLGNSNGFIIPSEGRGITIWGDLIFNTNDHFNIFANNLYSILKLLFSS